MKKIIILLTVALIACKKETKEPTPEPVITCETGKVLFSGKYRLLQANHDTIEIVWKSNCCPTKDANNYMVNGLGKAIQPIASNTITIFNQNYNLKTDETIPNGYTPSNEFKFSRMSNGDLTMTSSKLQYSTINFVRIN